MRSEKHGMQGSRGVALLIALLVTALLIALIFEFAYNTRVSLRAAINFRDSQRAYFLARSAVKVFMKFKELQDLIPQSEWGIVPMISEGDTDLRLRWEDEKGKIFINGRFGSPNNQKTVDWLKVLFTVRGADQAVLDTVVEEYKTKQIQSLSELHSVMGDEDFNKVSRFLSVHSGFQGVNINTASEEVIQSMGIEPTLILSNRPYTNKDSFDAGVKSYLDVTSTVYTVYAQATVGGYLKQVEAVIDRSSNAVNYWRAM